jgi:eukaryotic-like serine/threonine-protein kinase
MDTTLAHLQVGQLLDGRYRVDARLARGGMATVYLGTDTRLERTVALKIAHAELAHDADFVRRFIGEARSVARLSSPNVVAVYDQGADGDILFLAMEYVAGRTLRELLTERGRLSPREALDIIEGVLTGLSAAHAAGIVHRDVKPENVLITAGNAVKVADFGLARAAAMAGHTKTGTIIGTAAYLAPEQVTQSASDARTDVYAAGVMLFEVLTGTQPHTGETPLAVAYKHVNEVVPAPSSVTPGLPPALDALVALATSRNPDLRPADAGQFLQAITEVRRGLPIAGTQAAGQPASPGGYEPGFPPGLPAAGLSAPGRSAPGLPAAGPVLPGAPAAAGSSWPDPSASPGSSRPGASPWPGGSSAPDGWPSAAGSSSPGSAARAGQPTVPGQSLPGQSPRGQSFPGQPAPPGAPPEPGAQSFPWLPAPETAAHQEGASFPAASFLPAASSLPGASSSAGDPALPGAAGRGEPRRGRRGRDRAVEILPAVITGPAADGQPAAGQVADLASAMNHTLIVPGAGLAFEHSDEPLTGRVHAPSGYRRRREPGLQRWLFSRRLAYVALAAAAVLVIGLMTWWVTNGQYETVPQVGSMTKATARTELRNLGFTVKTGHGVHSNVIPRGEIIRTDPATGARAHRGSVVTLIPSLGPVLIRVPSVTGMKLADAEAALRRAGLTLGKVTNATSTTIPLGVVISTNPVAGLSWPQPRPVRIVQSAGLPLPNLVGQQQSAAQQQAQQDGFQLNPVQDTKSDQPAGTITRQSPRPGTPITPGEVVTIRVSAGPQLVDIPNVDGQNERQAVSILTQAGFQVTVDRVGRGHQVFNYTPTGQAPKGSTITIFIGFGGLP